ncbi:MAG: bifunctional hydroxymethylpyrimidine kinase/phosphomethylpyrimidine kinase [Desulfurococcaceae archaeon]
MAPTRRIPVAMTIAGSDSGGGAGIQADLKTFSALGVYGTTAITSLTAQNTREVTAIHDLPGWFVYEQIRVVVEDIGVHAAKTGMLSNSDIINHVARAVREYSIPLVVDPVMVAKSGARLLKEEAVEALVKEILPLARVVTPNIPEAEVLSGMKVRSVEDMERAAKIVAEKYGPEAVVVKGGHLEGGKVVDVLYYRGRYYRFESERVEGCHHGGGCSYSAEITAYLAKGLNVVESVAKAKDFITHAIRYGVRVGRGHCPVNPVAWLEIPAEKYRVLNEVKEAVELLLKNSGTVLQHVPEVGLNVVEAIDSKYASSVDDVAGVVGRIVKAGKKLVAVGPVEFGASSHVARLVLEVMKYDPEIRAAVNVKYSKELVEKAIAKGYVVVFVDRRLEPEEIRRVEGASIPWIVREAFSKATKTPDAIYDVGDVGKEAMIRLLGKTAPDAVKKLLDLVS